EHAASMRGAQRHRLRAVSLVPRRLVADHRAGDRVFAHPVDVVDVRRADRPSLCFDGPPDIALRIRDAPEELLLLLHRLEYASRTVARDVRITGPRHELFGVARDGRSEHDLRPTQYRTEHRRESTDRL